MTEYKTYTRTGQISARKCFLSTSLEGVSVSDPDQQQIGRELASGAPEGKLIGYIAVNPDDPKGKWFINLAYFEKNYYKEKKVMVAEVKGTFGWAIEQLKAGRAVRRSGWNGKGMFIYLVRGSKVHRSVLRNEAAEHPVAKPSGFVEFQGHIDMKTAQGTVCVGWLASQADMLSEDWELCDA